MADEDISIVMDELMPTTSKLAKSITDFAAHRSSSLCQSTGIKALLPPIMPKLPECTGARFSFELTSLPWPPYLDMNGGLMRVYGTTLRPQLPWGSLLLPRIIGKRAGHLLPCSGRAFDHRYLKDGYPTGSSRELHAGVYIVEELEQLLIHFLDAGRLKRTPQAPSS